jgi:hypothetical protein
MRSPMHLIVIILVIGIIIVVWTLGRGGPEQKK